MFHSMKKALFFCATAVMGLSVLSCCKDDIPGNEPGFVINNCQLIRISAGKEYAKDVYTPTYDAQHIPSLMTNTIC